MDAMRGTLPARRPSVTGRGTAVAVGLALVAALWGGFVVGRAGVPATQGDAPPEPGVHEVGGGTQIPTVVRPTRERGTVKGGGDAPLGFDIARPGPHHRVKGL